MKTIGVIVLLSLLFPRIVMAQDATESATIQASSSSEVQYELAYPGILPDSPIYFLKAMRDRVVSMLITDSTKKIQFLVLTSDKRMFASMMLFEKEKYALGVDTLSKSNNYMHEAATTLTEFRKTHKDQALSLRSHMVTSIRKHRELAEKAVKSVPSENRTAVTQEIKRLQELELLVSKLK